MLRRRGGDLFEMLESEGRLPVKVVPIRFPIAEETYEVMQVINEPIGLVERYILEAIIEFGPCLNDDITNLLSVDGGLISDIIDGLIKSGVDVAKDGNRYSAGESLRASIAQRQFAKRVQQQRSFIVNPLTGNLLPIKFLKDSNHWLVPFVTESEEGEAGNWMRVRIGDRALNGSRSLSQKLMSSDIEEREKLGIPEGGVELVDDTCLDRKLYSVLAFAVITKKLEVEVYSAVDFTIRLSCEETSSLDYWNQLCHDVQPWVFAKPRSIKEVAEHFAQNLKGVECRQVNGRTLAVSVQNPEEALSVDSRNETEEFGAMAKLQRNLINGWYWNVKDFGVLRLIAGDAATESRLVVLRGVIGLRQLFRNRRPTEKNAIIAWWKEFKSASSSRFCDREDILSISLDDLLVEAEKVPDLRFLDWLDDVVSVDDE